jgi:serine/threonine protein kinase
MVDHAFHYPNDQGAPLPVAIGRFRVVERAPGERGSQASVYRALDPVTGQEVALKVLGSQYESYTHSLLAALVGDRDMEELRREAQLLAGLHHPNIVSVIETWDDPALGPYTVMEWMPGGDLTSHLGRAPENRLPIEECLRIAQDILAGLSAAHQAGVIHRDIKPGNILLDSHGRAKLADFGIAGDITGGEALPGRGTLGYMAPEQEDPQHVGEVGPATDIYAVGVVLFEMLAGRRPVLGEDVLEVRPQVPEITVFAVTRATHQDPRQRYSSAQEMARALAG